MITWDRTNEKLVWTPNQGQKEKPMNRRFPQDEKVVEKKGVEFMPSDLVLMRARRIIETADDLVMLFSQLKDVRGEENREDAEGKIQGQMDKYLAAREMLKKSIDYAESV